MLKLIYFIEEIENCQRNQKEGETAEMVDAAELCNTF